MDFSKLQIEGIAYYEARYETIVNLPLIGNSPIYLSDHSDGQTQVCRFCKRSSQEVTFQSTAHAVSEFLGNKSLISMNECDACNTFLAHNYEDHLAKWFGPLRTISQMAGKTGVPTYKDKGGRIRIEMGEEGLHFTIVNADLMKQLSKDGPIAFKLPVDTPSQPYVPIRAAMALVKTACSLCPPSELLQCIPAIDWLMGRLSARITSFPVLYAFTPGPNPYEMGQVMLLRRKVDEPIPYLCRIVATANYRFQYFVPFCPMDSWLKNGEESPFSTRQYPVPFGEDWNYGATEYRLFNWAGEERIVNEPQVTFNIDRAEIIQPLDGEADSLSPQL